MRTLWVDHDQSLRDRLSPICGGACASTIEDLGNIGLLPFDHERQLASVVVRAPGGTTELVTKGAPEAVLARCIDAPAESGAVLERLFADGARVVAVATREAPGLFEPSAADEQALRLAGFLAFVDRPKADAGASIATGWFVESLATQTLVVFVIRTRRVPSFHSRPSRAMIAVPITCAAIGAILPFTPSPRPSGSRPYPSCSS